MKTPAHKHICSIFDSKTQVKQRFSNLGTWEQSYTKAISLLHLENLHSICYQHPRVISDPMKLGPELKSKNVLVLGLRNLPLFELARAFSVNIREIQIVDYFTLDLKVRDFKIDEFDEYWANSPAQAFGGHWDFLIARKSLTSQTIATDVLNIVFRNNLRIKEIALVPSTQKINN